MAMEATIFIGWIYNHLLPHAEKVKVEHPLILGAIAAANRKNDLIDAAKVADCLRCDFLPECHTAPTPIRDRRRIMRYGNPGTRCSYGSTYHAPRLPPWRTKCLRATKWRKCRFNVFGSQNALACPRSTSHKMREINYLCLISTWPLSNKIVQRDDRLHGHYDAWFP
jgi:hypothetical protein